MCGKTERWGPPKTALCQCRLCSVVSPKTTQTHICITNNLLYFTTSLTIYFTLLHSLKTRLFINPVLNNPNGQLRAHSLHPDYLPHSTPIPIPHSTSPTPPPIYRGGAQGDSAQGLHAAGRPDLTTWF